MYNLLNRRLLENPKDEAVFARIYKIHWFYPSILKNIGKEKTQLHAQRRLWVLYNKYDCVILGFLSAVLLVLA